MSCPRIHRLAQGWKFRERRIFEVGALHRQYNDYIYRQLQTCIYTYSVNDLTACATMSQLFELGRFLRTPTTIITGFLGAGKPGAKLRKLRVSKTVSFLLH